MDRKYSCLASERVLNVFALLRSVLYNLTRWFAMPTNKLDKVRYIIHHWSGYADADVKVVLIPYQL